MAVCALAHTEADEAAASLRTKATSYDNHFSFAESVFCMVENVIKAAALATKLLDIEV